VGTLILASASPRRRELLERAGLAFEVRAADLDESAHPDEAPERYVARIARAKAELIAQHHPDGVVLAADTAVIRDQDILGKPRDADDARKMLASLSARTHRVLTAVSLVARGAHDAQTVQTEVDFRPLRSREIDWYLSTGEPLDKAGAYAIQGIGGFLVRAIRGSHSNVIGLPVVETLAMLQRAGVTMAWERP
jgi:septum formation protein